MNAMKALLDGCLVLVSSHLKSMFITPELGVVHPTSSKICGLLDSVSNMVIVSLFMFDKPLEPSPDSSAAMMFESDSFVQLRVPSLLQSV